MKAPSSQRPLVLFVTLTVFVFAVVLYAVVAGDGDGGGSAPAPVVEVDVDVHDPRAQRSTVPRPVSPPRRPALRPSPAAPRPVVKVPARRP